MLELKQELSIFSKQFLLAYTCDKRETKKEGKKFFKKYQAFLLKCTETLLMLGNFFK